MVNERLIKQRREEALEIRKKMWWMLPFLLGLGGFSWWITDLLFSNELLRLFALAPIVRVTPIGWLGIPLMGLLSVMLFALLLLKAIPYHGIWSKRLEWLTVTAGFSLLGLIVIVPLTSPLIQNHYMPKLGYSKCLLLEGGGSHFGPPTGSKTPTGASRAKPANG